MNRRTRHAALGTCAVLAVLAAVLLRGTADTAPAPTAPGSTPPRTAQPAGPAGEPAGGLAAQAYGGLGAVDLGVARAQLAALTIAPEDTTNPYDRDAWGQRWAGHGDSCDTREVVLRMQGTGWVNGPSCRPSCPATGPACWTSIYDDVAVHDPAQLQIDHLVPVAEANRSGTRAWTPAQRRAYYQDINLLIAVTASSNTSKSDGDPAVWRPANTAVWCWYAVHWTATKTTYRLTADQAEHDALARMLDTCPPNR